MKDNKKIFYRGVLFGLITALWLIIVFNGGHTLYRHFIKKEISVNNKVKMINKIIDNKYVGKYDPKAVEEAMFLGMLYGVGDPYTCYMTANDFKNFIVSTEGRYSGIGAVVMAAEDGGIIIVNPYEGAPAKEAGLLAGDKILKIGDVDIRNISIDEAISMMKGEDGTKINMKVYRKSTDVYFDIDVMRREIDVPTVSHKLLDNKVGLIRISAFERVTLEQFKEAYNDLISKNMERLIIDLRNNPGGLLLTVVNIARMLIPEGVIVYTEDKNGKQEFYNSYGEAINMPLVLLVNGNSASASEVLSGAVKDHGVGVLVGEKTFGKALVQDIYSLPDGSAVKLTIAKYYTPSGACINGEGITPNYIVHMDENLSIRASTLSISEDIQLQKAIDVIEKMNK